MGNSKKQFLISVSLCFVIISLSVSYVVYEYYYKDIWQYAAKRKERHRKIEKLYKEKPSLSEAFDLLDYYMGEKNYDKALVYAKECLTLGAKDELISGKINFFLARIYHQKHQDNLAREHLLVAAKMSGERINELLQTAKEYNMQYLLTEEEWRSFASKWVDSLKKKPREKPPFVQQKQ